MRLKRLGFFDSTPNSDAAQVIAAMRSLTPRSHEDAILSYLKSGTPIFASCGLAFDILEEGQPPIGPADILTDGTWAWTADVAFFVEKYHIALPDAFVEFVERNQWKCPHLPEDFQFEGFVE